jgi:hypothetical protein
MSRRRHLRHTFGIVSEKHPHVMASPVFSPFQQVDGINRRYRAGWRALLAKFGEDHEGMVALLEFLVHEFPPSHLHVNTVELSAETYADNHTFLNGIEFITPHAGDTSCILTPGSEAHVHSYEPPTVSRAIVYLQERSQWAPDFDREVIITAQDYLVFDERLTQRSNSLKVRVTRCSALALTVH